MKRIMYGDDPWRVWKRGIARRNLLLDFSVSSHIGVPSIVPACGLLLALQNFLMGRLRKGRRYAARQVESAYYTGRLTVKSGYCTIKGLEKTMIANIQECIKPISYVKTNAADMMNFVNDRKEPLIITQNGESRAVLIDVESYQEMRNAFSLLQMLQFSETDVKKGKCRPAADVFASLRRKYSSGD